MIFHILLWFNRWRDESKEVLKKLIDIWMGCDESTCPNLYIALHICFTLPFTSCESEGSFRQLKLIKSPRQSTMTEECQSGLALLKIYQTYCENLCSSSKNGLTLFIYSLLYMCRTLYRA